MNYYNERVEIVYKNYLGDFKILITISQNERHKATILTLDDIRMASLIIHNGDVVKTRLPGDLNIDDLVLDLNLGQDFISKYITNKGKYFIVTGDEFGVDFDDSLKFFTDDRAAFKVYNELVSHEHPVVIWYEVTETGFKVVKEYNEFK